VKLLKSHRVHHAQYLENLAKQKAIWEISRITITPVIVQITKFALIANCKQIHVLAVCTQINFVMEIATTSKAMIMTNEEFIAAVAKMRSLQKEYFRDRNRSTLDQCKFIEREVDRELEKLLSPVQQTTLF
jgi:hypothetical protein